MDLCRCTHLDTLHPLRGNTGQTLPDFSRGDIRFPVPMAYASGFFFGLPRYKRLPSVFSASVFSSSSGLETMILVPEGRDGGGSKRARLRSYGGSGGGGVGAGLLAPRGGGQHGQVRMIVFAWIVLQ